MLRFRIIFAAAALAALPGSASGAGESLPGWSSFRICAGAAAPYPQYAVAASPAGLWVACPGQGSLQRVSLQGRVTGTVRTGTVRPWSIAFGGGRVWIAERGPLVYGIDARGRQTGVLLNGSAPYVWFAAGSVWTLEDGAKTLVRIDPAKRRVRARIRSGDGPAAVLAHGGRLWVMNHRDATLDRIDLATNRVTRLGKLPGDAPERMVLAKGSLWITGRGTDVLRVDPETGAVQATIEIGAGAIDLAAARGAVWVAVPTTDDDLKGNPFLDRLVKIDPVTSSVVETIRPAVPVVVGGFAHDGATAWLADVVNGNLYRLDAA